MVDSYLLEDRKPDVIVERDRLLFTFDILLELLRWLSYPLLLTDVGIHGDLMGMEKW